MIDRNSVLAMNILSPVRQGLLPPQMKQTPNKDKKNPLTLKH